ncbi:MAG TPA: DUF5615 family PIN-like protein [Roseiarcus sp.]|nr:DUF5615 family PIN-like protein [Roseiarcus sp.]
MAAPGATDPDVLAWAAREGRILLTFDKDFGELAAASNPPRARGLASHADPKGRRCRTAARQPGNGALGRSFFRH